VRRDLERPAMAPWHYGYCHSEIFNAFIQPVKDLVVAPDLDLPGCASRWEGHVLSVVHVMRVSYVGAGTTVTRRTRMKASHT